MIEDIHRMAICSVCGADACFGFGITIEGARMGDFGDWRCGEHHPKREARYTREEWADARERGKLYPDPSSPEGEWQRPKDIISKLLGVDLDKQDDAA